MYAGSPLAVFYLVGGLALASALPFLFVSSPARPFDPAAADGAHGSARHRASRPLELTVTTAVVVLVFFTTAAETAIGNWVYTFSVRELGSSDVQAALSNSAFWGAFTVGRVIGVSTDAACHSDYWLMRDSNLLGPFYRRPRHWG